MKAAVQDLQEQQALEAGEADKKRLDSPRSRQESKSHSRITKDDSGGSNSLEEKIRAHQPLSRIASSNSFKAAKSKPTVMKSLFKLT